MIKVLFSTREHSMELNPYLRQLQRALGELSVEVVPFSWKSALTQNYDVLHVHWPEFLVTHRRAELKPLYWVLAPILLARLRLTGTAVVRTMHNLEAHEGETTWERFLLRQLDVLTTRRVVMNAHELEVMVADMIPHGDYSSWYRRVPDSVKVENRVLFAGMIRAYKNVPELVTAFRDVGLRGATLHIAGRTSTGLDEAIVHARGDDDRISTHFEFLSDHELSDEMGYAALVALPYAQNNSGVALLALSLNRPVLMPASDLGRSLQHEVGDLWVHLYDGSTVTAQDIEKALLTPPPAGSSPDLKGRTWPRVAAQHKETYEKALEVMA